MSTHKRRVDKGPQPSTAAAQIRDPKYYIDAKRARSNHIPFLDWHMHAYRHLHYVHNQCSAGGAANLQLQAYDVQ
jgi:hypothetical protein